LNLSKEKRERYIVKSCREQGAQKGEKGKEKRHKARFAKKENREGRFNGAGEQKKFITLKSLTNFSTVRTEREGGESPSAGGSGNRRQDNEGKSRPQKNIKNHPSKKESGSGIVRNGGQEGDGMPPQKTLKPVWKRGKKPKCRNHCRPVYTQESLKPGRRKKKQSGKRRLCIVARIGIGEKDDGTTQGYEEENGGN